MICVAALIVFSILAAFSAKYRALAKEAWACVFLKVTLRPCHSGLDKRVRMMAVAPFLKRSPKTARAVYLVFPFFSFLLVVATIVSFIYLAWGGYNYALYGNCNGPGSAGFCIFDPNGPGTSGVAECSETIHSPDVLIVPTERELANFTTIHPDAVKTIVFVGCYACPYTRQAADAILAIARTRTDVRVIFVPFPLPGHANSTLAANAAECVAGLNPDAFLAYADALYHNDLQAGLPPVPASVNADALAVCSAKEHPLVEEGIALGTRVGVYGTPTYFINGKTYVGPLNERSLNTLVDR